jgi:hypothetical protein
MFWGGYVCMGGGGRGSLGKPDGRFYVLVQAKARLHPASAKHKTKQNKSQMGGKRAAEKLEEVAMPEMAFLSHWLAISMFPGAIEQEQEEAVAMAQGQHVAAQASAWEWEVHGRPRLRCAWCRQIPLGQKSS